MGRPSDLLQKPSDYLNRTLDRTFSADEREQKRLFYERMSPRRRRFVDRIGFEAWDPFEAPKEPMDMRKDVTERTVQDLVREFLRTATPEMQSGEYARGAMECAIGFIGCQEKYLGVLDFCVWYHELLQREHSQK